VHGGIDGGNDGGNDGAADQADVQPVDNAPPLATCERKPTPLRTNGSTLALAIQPRLGDEALIFGEPNAAADGSTIMPLNFRFYVSHVKLTQATGAPVSVDLVDAAGAPEPHGVHLFNAEDPASQTLRVLAPAGSYTGITFTFGVDDVCNSRAPANNDPPLTTASQMVWPHFAGYLFLRYEAQVTPGTASDGGSGAAPPTMIHMGGFPGAVFAPVVTAAGSFTIGAQPTSRPLVLDMNALFAAATSEDDPPPVTALSVFPEVLAGDRLRQHAPPLPLFVLGP
jgi:hypothetical protein